MSILWIYDKPIDPLAGGTERATDLVIKALYASGEEIAGWLVIEQAHPNNFRLPSGEIVSDLLQFLRAQKVTVVVNQIGYSDWLLRQFLERGGRKWQERGGRIVTKLHFDPIMFPPSIADLVRDWGDLPWFRKVKRAVRIARLPIEKLDARKTLQAAYKYLQMKSDVFVILSEAHRQNLIRLSGSTYQNRIRIVPNPNTYMTPIILEKVLEKSKTALIVSRLDEQQKRLSLALRAWKIVMQNDECSDWQLKIVGDGPSRSLYEDLIRTLKIPNIELCGRTDPLPYYELASIYLHTAKREGWGLTIVEAMQNAVVPIVMNSSGVFADIIDNGTSGYLSRDGDVADLVRYVKILINDPSLRLQMGRNAIDKTQGNTIDNVVKIWKDIIATP
jgi:glycosyltransferase involved in cell wall biosynthesis